MTDGLAEFQPKQRTTLFHRAQCEQKTAPGRPVPRNVRAKEVLSQQDTSVGHNTNCLGSSDQLRMLFAWCLDSQHAKVQGHLVSHWRREGVDLLSAWPQNGGASGCM